MKLLKVIPWLIKHMGNIKQEIRRLRRKDNHEGARKDLRQIL